MGLKILSFNCRSIRNKVADVLSKLDELNIDVCLLQETWLNKGDESIIAEIRDYGYEIESRRRTNYRKGGGVAVLYKSHIDICVKKSGRFISFEHMLINIRTKNKLFRIINLYRPDYSTKHRVTPAIFFEEFCNLLSELVPLPGVLIITGDFNFHLESPEDYYVSRFIGILEEYSLYQAVTASTHENGGLIDLVITTDRNSIMDVEIHNDSVGSDHHPITFHVDCQLQQKNSLSELWLRDYKKLKIAEFKKDIMCNANLVKPSGDVDMVVDCFSKTLIAILDKHCPLEYKRFKKRPHSIWYTQELRELKRKRRVFERKLLKENTPENKENYRKIKRNYTWRLQEVRRKYYRERLSDSIDNAKSLHKTINKLTGKDNVHILPRHGSDKVISENMASFFTDKVRNIRTMIAAQTGNDERTCNPASSTMPTMTDFYETTKEDLHGIIKDMKSKSCILDTIPTWLVKICFDELKGILMYITNKSLIIENKFPTLFKHSTVTPVIKDKEEDSEVYNNYRPISNTSFISKMLEKIALAQIDAHIQRNDLHAIHQSGYRKYHSCETAMIKIVNDFNQILSNGDMVALILLDLSAAFDTIDHNLLIKKLRENFGITGNVLKWIISYLRDRSFSVNIRNVHSSHRELNFGVPQGSLMGPILFILYTKDISNIAETHGLSMHMYADDTQLYISFKYRDKNNVRMTSDSIQDCLRNIRSWMGTNFLKINPGKTKFIVIGSSYNIKNDFGGELIVLNDADGKEIEKLNAVVLLGVTIDSTISMKTFINTKCSEAYYKLRNIGRLRSCLDTAMRLMLVQNLILSKLDYCNALLANTPNYLINKLQKVMNGSVRFIYIM